MRLIDMLTFNDRERLGSAAAILNSFCLLAQFRIQRRMQESRSMFSMRAPGIGIRNIGSVRSRPLFQAPKHNEFEGPISGAKRKVFQILFVRLFFTILFVFTCLNNSVREICNRIKIRKEIPKILRWSIFQMLRILLFRSFTR